MFYAAVGSIETMKALGIAFWRPDIRQQMIAALGVLHPSNVYEREYNPHG